MLGLFLAFLYVGWMILEIRAAIVIADRECELRKMEEEFMNGREN